MAYFDDESSKWRLGLSGVEAWRVASGDLGRAKPRPGRRIPNGLGTLLPVTSKPTISIVRVLMFLVLSFGMLTGKMLTLLASPLVRSDKWQMTSDKWVDGGDNWMRSIFFGEGWTCVTSKPTISIVGLKWMTLLFFVLSFKMSTRKMLTRLASPLVRSA